MSTFLADPKNNDMIDPELKIKLTKFATDVFPEGSIFNGFGSMTAKLPQGEVYLLWAPPYFPKCARGALYLGTGKKLLVSSPVNLISWDDIVGFFSLVRATYEKAIELEALRVMVDVPTRAEIEAENSMTSDKVGG